MPRTDLLLADPRLAEAERRLGRALVKAAVSRAQQRARDGQIAPEQVADAAVAELPARATALTPVIGYDRAAQIAKQALAEDRCVKDVAAAQTGLSAVDLDRLLDPRRMLTGGISKG